VNVGMGPERVEDGRAATPRTMSRGRFEELLARRKRPSGERPGRPRAPPAPTSVRTRPSSREASRARDVRGAARAAIDAAARARQGDGTEATLAASGRLQERAAALRRSESEASGRGEGRVPVSAVDGAPPVAARGSSPLPAPPLPPAAASDLGPLAALA